MELILKTPPNKLPCICILFDKEYEASALNQAWVNTHKKSEYDLVFEVSENNLDLRLKLENTTLNYCYPNLKFYPDKLFRFLYDTKGAQYNFCHITQILGKHSLARTVTNRDKWVLKIKSVTVNKEF